MPYFLQDFEGVFFLASYHLEKKSLQFLAKWFLIRTIPEKGMPRLPAAVDSADTLPVGVMSQSGEKIVGCSKEQASNTRTMCSRCEPCPSGLR